MRWSVGLRAKQFISTLKLHHLQILLLNNIIHSEILDKKQTWFIIMKTGRLRQKFMELCCTE